VFLEKYITSPRHVEVQIFGDAHGHVVHLFERECSIQRRHQKIIEETPSPAVDTALRAKMTDAAVKLAKSIGYTNAGTIEFILAPDGAFYFLEVNTRLQVEHPVTEWVTGRDLVRAQVLVAAGEILPFTQQDLLQSGHAIECRIYAEDPAHGFLPSTGTLAHYAAPAGVGIRADSGVTQGSKVEVYYDPMLAKLSAHGRDRGEALARMGWALRHFVVLGVRTNIEFLHAVVTHPEFVAGRIDTHFLDRHKVATCSDAPPPEAIMAAALAARDGSQLSRAEAAISPTNQSPWQTAGAWRG
jgi:acetyl/propionyl-CoA carboxylase alpha subunit